MVFCYQNRSDILWENIVLVTKKNFWNSRLKAENLQSFEITKTIYSNSKRSEQFLITESFFNLFLEVSNFSKNRTIFNSNWKKLLGFRNLQEKLENNSSLKLGSRSKGRPRLFRTFWQILSYCTCICMQARRNFPKSRGYNSIGWE